MSKAKAGSATTSQHCSHLRHLRGPALSVYEFSRRLTAGKEGRKFFASNATAADGTGWSRETVSTAKKTLVAEGWFKLLRSNREYGRNGKFKPSSYQVFDHEAWADKHPGRCPSRSESDAAENRHGQEGVDRHGSDRVNRHGSDPALSLSMKSESTPEKISPSAKAPSEGSSSEEEEKRQTRDDPRFEAVLSFFQTEFKRLHKVNPPFDASDATALRKLLRQQPQAKAQEIVGWLKNAFASTTQFPLVGGFRLREFVCHFSKYLSGPRHRSTAEAETEDHDNYPTIEDARPKIRIRSRPVEVPNIRHPKDPY